MQYTPHYNLNLPEGSDIVNPLVQDNPNYSAIDAALYANKLRVIGDATVTKTGTTHTITRSDTDIPVFKFIATGDYDIGDTFTVDGVSVTPRVSDGSTPKNKAFVINSTVFCILDGTILNLIGVEGEKSRNHVTVTGDGVKTKNQALNELFALLDMSQISNDTIIDYDNNSGTHTTFPLIMRSNTQLIFGFTRILGSYGSGTEMGVSAASYVRTITLQSTPAIAVSSAEGESVLVSGASYTLYY